MLKILAQEKFWLNKSDYANLERVYYEKQTKVLFEAFREFKNSQVKSLNMTNCENCLICKIIAQIDIHNDISKLLEKVQQWDEIDSKMHLNMYKQINKFKCLVCFFKTSKFNDWKCHIMSLAHMENCHKIENLYSYVCDYKICKLLLYGPKKSLIKHNMDKHSFDGGFFGMSTFMAEVMKEYLVVDQKPLYFCSHCKKFAKTPIHTDVKLSSKSIKFPIEYYCKYCRVHFLSSQEMIDYHFLSVEHMTIRCFDELCSDTKISLKQKKLPEESKVLRNSNKIKRNENKNAKLKSFSTSNIQTIKPNTLQTFPVSQRYDIKSEYTQNVKLNKSLTNTGIDEKSILDNGQTVKKSLVNNDFLETLNNDVQKSCNESYENMKLPNHSKYRQQYTNYFKHKINLLKKLKQHEDLIMKTLSYYCDVCDFIAVEKYFWDKHNQLKHSVDSNRSTSNISYCSTCSMFISGNYQEHNHTIEHSIFLNFLQLLKPVEVLKDKTSLIKLVKSGSSDINSINLEQKEKIELNSSDCFKETKYSKNNNNRKNSDFSLMEEPSINKGDTMIMENSLLLSDKYEYKQDEKNTSNATKLMIHNEITSNNSVNTLMTIPYQANVLVDKMPGNINLVNALTDDLNFENKKIGKLDEDQLYGEYVIQRLKNIKDTTIKQHVKLEIDYIFYTKMK